MQEIDKKIDIFRWWGKTISDGAYHPLIFHMADTAEMTGQLFEKRYQGTFSFFSESKKLDLMKKISQFCAFLHDIGKFSDAFQSLNPDLYKEIRGKNPVKQPKSHKTLGWYYWKHFFIEKFVKRGISEKVAYLMGKISTGHHGKPIEGAGKRTERIEIHHTFTADDKKYAEKYFNWAFDRYLEKIANDLSTLDNIEDNLFLMSWTINGLVTLSDWMVSREDFIRSIQKHNDFEDYISELPKYVATFFKKEELHPSAMKSSISFHSLFPELEEFEPTPLQTWAGNYPLGTDGPSLFILEDSTGSGKTEAALLLASRLISKLGLSGFYFGLPSMATSNAMHSRMFPENKRPFNERLYDDPKDGQIVLAHSMTAHARKLGLIKIDDDHRAKNWLNNNRKLALLKDIGLGTIDQAISGILPNYHHTLKLLGLSEKVLIVDEVHDYAPYTNELLKVLIRYRANLGLPTILLTATLSNRRRETFLDAFFEDSKEQPIFEKKRNEHFPRVTVATLNQVESMPLSSRKKTKKIKIEFLHEENEIKDRIFEETSKGHCIAWILNTVSDAMDAHKRLTENFPQESIELIHSRFTIHDRLQKETDLLNTFGPDSSEKQRRGKIVVGTQILEQSLDVDFDVMITDLAPMDRIIQRVGRLQRHERPARQVPPKVIVHSPKWTMKPAKNWYENKFEKASYVYKKPGMLWKTMEVLRQNEFLVIPDQNRDYIESVLSDEAEGTIPAPLLEIDDRETYGKEGSAKAMAKMNQINILDGYQRGEDYQEDTPTRRGQDQILCRFVKKNGGKVTSWSQKNGHNLWETGDISLYAYQVTGPDLSKPDETLEEAIDSMTDVSGRNPEPGERLVVPFEKVEDTWVGKAINQDGLVTLFYDSKRGLQFDGGK